MTAVQMSDSASPAAGIIQDGTRRGACPTLDAPMQTGDGLLARIRVKDRMLRPEQLACLSRLAVEHGNGLVEITARGNLQVRGLTPTSASPFAAAVSTLVNIESGLVVDISPLAGIDPNEIGDPRPLAHAIRGGAISMADRLGPKVSVVIDAGGQVSLAALKADIRLAAIASDCWNITLGGGKPQTVDQAGAISTTLAVLGALAAMGPEARATDLFPRRSPEATSHPPATQWGTRGFTILGGYTTPIALPFGSASGQDLIRLCATATDCGVGTLRLAPDHLLLLDYAPPDLTEAAAAFGFITRSDDPRQSISACVGNQGCMSGHIAARQVASAVAPLLHSHQHLHVSGCSKGCAHPRRADVTLVGRKDGIGLVINGRAGDTPDQILDEAHLADAFAPIRVPDDAI